MNRTDLRNIAIIAHVDHGKTTLVDAMLRQSNVYRENQTIRERVMDSHDLERERGITILAKNTAVRRGDIKINVVDTPGHADFGGEVERVLTMVDGVLLLVDAVEGPMPQTRFVLGKALALGHRAVVVVNKIDRPYADAARVVDETFDLFVDLGADDDQAHFEVVYTNALAGRAGAEPDAIGDDLEPLFEAIMRLPSPDVELDGPARLLVSNFDYDDYKGRVSIGRLQRGTISSGQSVVVVSPDRAPRSGRIAELFAFENLGREPVDEARAGEIVALTGLSDVGIGETICHPDAPEPLPPVAVEEPTVRMAFTINTSPFSGREGDHVTSRALRDRLKRELERNVALRVDDTESADTLVVSGRGELHLAILIEEMRRESYEFAVGRPQVIEHVVDGQRQEPFEMAHIEVGDAYVGAVVDLLGRRRGTMLDLHSDGSGVTRMRWRVPTRGLLGFRNRFLSATAGTGVMHTLFDGYSEHSGTIEVREHGSLVAHETGTTTSYALDTAQGRGELFVGPGEEVYAGQVVGRRPKAGDLVVNVCKRKQVTNHRKSFAEEGILLTPPVPVSLDMALETIVDDEWVEVTPVAIRMRKDDLVHERRNRAAKRARQAAEAGS
jgi:GTP-binding protein